MIDEHNVVAVSRFDGDAYKSSQAAELTLNAAILRRLILESMSFRQPPESIRCETVGSSIVCSVSGLANQKTTEHQQVPNTPATRK
jgi:hypothetical protein